MHANSILAVTGLLGLVAAQPFVERHHGHHAHHHHNRRELVWETVYEEVIMTVPVTKTVWLEPGETPPAAPKKPAEYSPPKAPAYTPKSSSPVAPAYTPPAPSSSAPAAPAYTPPASSSSSPVAPAYTPPASSSSPVAPAYTPPASTYVAPVPTSTYVAPVTPSSSYVAPVASTYSAPAASSSAPTSDSGSAGGYSTGMAAHGTEYTGEMTWYDPSIGYNACGTICAATEHVVAVSHVIWESYGVANSNMSPLCNATVTITSVSGEAIQAKVVDKCPGCTEGNLDLTNTLFQIVTGESDGRVPGIKWEFN